MTTTRNTPCPCGSGLRFKNCCGKIENETNSVPSTSTFEYSLPLGGSEHRGIDKSFERKIADLLRKGNIPLAEILLRMSLENDSGNATTFNYLGQIAQAVNHLQFAIQYFREAIRLASNWEVPRINLEQVSKRYGNNEAKLAGDAPKANQTKNSGRFLLIKAWGYGFWSDVAHVVGQLLVAELSGRIPIVHWGSNSLFGHKTDENAFEFYFEKVSASSLDDIKEENYDIWPPKWNHRNLMQGEINKWSGSYSRVAGLYLLRLPEKVLVTDFYTGVIDLMPWIPADHHLHGLSVNELYRYLVRRYLRPRKTIEDEVGIFYTQHLASKDFIAVHARGSDKVLEMSNLDEVNGQYEKLVDQCLSNYNCQRIFLMTDDTRIRDHYVKRYGDRIVTTSCQRTDSSQGIHYKEGQDRRRLGTEVMIDAYIATKARAFIGNGFSNPSLFVHYLKEWPENDVYLIGQNMHHCYNTFIHDWQ